MLSAPEELIQHHLDGLQDHPLASAVLSIDRQRRPGATAASCARR
jgi:hypothetical protein